MTLPRLSASRSKSEFFRHLGWQETDENHKRLYGLMMEEAACGRDRACKNQENLTPQSRANPSLSPPYSSSMITETARHQEVQRIYRYACPETKEIYDKGVIQDGSNWDNWIVRWCLWHVFRYRDDRNRNRGHVTTSTTYSVITPNHEQAWSGESSSQYSIASSSGTARDSFYDPVRDR